MGRGSGERCAGQVTRWHGDGGWGAWREIQVRSPRARQELCTQWGLWVEARPGRAPLEVCKPGSRGSIEAQERTLSHLIDGETEARGKEGFAWDLS